MTIQRSEGERAVWLKEHEPARLRFEAERSRRAENRKHIGESGRCAGCGEQCGVWTRCKPCRLKTYEEDARFGPPLGEHFPTPPSKAETLQEIFPDAPESSDTAPWETL